MGTSRSVARGLPRYPNSYRIWDRSTPETEEAQKPGNFARHSRSVSHGAEPALDRQKARPLFRPGLLTSYFWGE